MFKSTPALFFLSLLTYLGLAALLFGLAGRWDLPWFWATLGVFIASHLIMGWVVFRRDPDLVQERLKPGPGVPFWDRLILGLAGVLMLAGLVLGPLDVGRLHWSDSVAVPLRFVALVGIGAGMALMIWAMAVNTYFSKVVRIQKERGHRVIQSGPYRLIRHPGYVGWLVLWISFNLALGSWLAVGISLLVAVIVVVRTALEDRFLQQGLPGYTEYAQQVRWRLVPGIW